MKVLVLHNAYQKYGGEDTVVHMETRLLADHGNLVGLHIVSNDCISGYWGKLIASLGVVFSITGYRTVRKLIRETQPDVVHVHNFFPLLSPSVFYACQAEGVPVLLTLHNYRVVCPTALLMHDGKMTERSLREGPWWAFRHKVYRDSLAGTFLLCLMIWLHRRLGTWHKQVDRFIVLSEFGRKKFIEGNIPADRLILKPNFVDMPLLPVVHRSGLLFVGRLSPEKGINVLLKATKSSGHNPSFLHKAVRLVGDGPLASQVKQSGLHHLGILDSADVRNQMQLAIALLIPSICPEAFGMVLVEAYANGLPVIASRIGALAELVEDGVTGLLFEPGNADDLAAKMGWAIEHPDEMRRMGDAARARYEALYTPERNYEQLMLIYRDAIFSNASKRQK